MERDISKNVVPAFCRSISKGGKATNVMVFAFAALPIFWLQDFDQSVNSRKNSIDTGERKKSGTDSGEAE